MKRWLGIILCLVFTLGGCREKPKPYHKFKPPQLPNSSSSQPPLIQERQTLQDVFRKLQERFKEIKDYHCIFDTFVAKDNKTDQRSYNYYFKKPYLVRMEIIKGQDEGTRLVYNGCEVKVKPGGGLLSFFTFNFEPNNERICDLRGTGMAQSDWGFFIEEHLKYLSKYRGKISSGEKVESKETTVLELISESPAKTMDIAREKIWVDSQEQIILKYEQFNSSGEKIRASLYRAIKINQNLADELFKDP